MGRRDRRGNATKYLLNLAAATLALMTILACGGSTEQPASSPTGQSVLFATPPGATSPSADDRPDPGIVVQIDSTAIPYPTSTPYPTATPYPTQTPAAGAEPPVSATAPAPTQTDVVVPATTPPAVQATPPGGTGLKYPKVGSALNDIIARVESGEISAEDAAAQVPLHRGDAVAVTIYLSGNVGGLVSFLEDRGIVPRNVGEDYVEAFIPILLLPETSQQPGVLTVRVIIPPEPAHSLSGVDGNGPGVHKSPAWNESGYTGSGIKVGVIDVGFVGFSHLMGTELPESVRAMCWPQNTDKHTEVLTDCEHRGDHGTAVAETVMDIAPDVTLYIANFRTTGDVAKAVDWMIRQEVDVINVSLRFRFDGPGDGTSRFGDTPLKAIDKAVENGIVWVNAAGNQGNKTWFKRGPFASTTISLNGEDTKVIIFDGEDFTNAFYQGSIVELRWDDTWSGAIRDLDLYLAYPKDSSGVNYNASDIGASSRNPQSGEIGQSPHEVVWGSGQYDIIIAHKGGSEPTWIQLMGWSGSSWEHNTREGSISNPAESANPGMLSVGAAHWSSGSIESFSSRGPTPDGRVKPDVVAADCGKTHVDTEFCGTSQAAPHVTGMTALVRQRFPSYTPAQVVSYLKDNAVQPVSPDTNNTWGHGLIVLPPPPSQLPGLPSIQSTTPGANSLTVEWRAPSSGDSAITAYDLRHIRSDSSNKGDSNWTVVENVWTTGSGALSYELTGLTSGTQYDVQVRAVSAAGDGPWSATVTGRTSATAPRAATNLTATPNGQTQLNLSWREPSSDGGAVITGYWIEASEDGSTWSDLIYNTGSTSTVYSHTGLTAGSTRYYRVSAINSAGAGAASNVASAITASADVPGAPATGSVTTGANSLMVTWTAPGQTGGSLITAYDLRHIRSDAPNKADFNWTLVQDAWIGSGGFSYMLTGLDGGAQYDVQARAVNAAGDGPWSATETGRTSETVPGASTGLTATANGQTQIDLSWTAPSDDGGAAITGYKVEVSSDGSSWSDLDSDTDSTSTTYSHTDLTVGVQRHYRVSAINSAGTGPASNVAVATTGAAPAPDLVVDTPTVSESSPTAGASFTLNATVRNQGNGSSASTTLRYYRSTDSTITTADTEVGTDSVFRLNASAGGDESISLTAPSTAGTYYYGACVESVSGESNTANNCSSAVTVTVGAAPEEPANQRYSWQGTTTVVTWDPSTGADNYKVYYDDFFDDNCRLSSSGTPSFCEELAGNVVGTTYTHTSPDEDRNYYWITACNSAGCSDIDSGNPARLEGLDPSPDLVVDTLTVSSSAPTAGARFTLNATVRNQGNGSSASTTLRYYRSTDSTITTTDTEVGTDSVFRLNASASGDESISLTAPSTAGTYYYGACVESVSGESDTANNCSSAVTVTVGAAPAPDLVVDTPTVSSSSPTAGASFTLNATVRNQGNGPSAFTTLRYYRSTDSTVSASDTSAGTDSVFRLDASESGDESISLTAPSTPGTYYYGACVDSVSSESDTTNNCSSAVTVTVSTTTSPPDAPTGLTATANGQTEIDLSWTAPSDDGGAAITGYKVEVSSDGSSWSDLDSNTDSTSTSYSHTGLTAASTRHYRVSAINSAGTGTASNVDSATTSQAAAGSPDLVVNNTLLSANVTPGYHLSLNATVQNEGVGSSAPTTLRYYSSADTTITTGDTQVGTNPVDGLVPSGSSREAIGVTAPATPGTYYYGACVDSVSGESNTTNNCSSATEVTVRVVNQPPQVVGDVDDLTVALGESFQVDISGVFSEPDGEDFGNYGFTLRTRGIISGTVNAKSGILSLWAIGVGATTVAVEAADIHGNGSGPQDLFVVTVVPASTTPTAPGAPTGLTATADGQTEIDLSWTAPSDNGGAAITGYKVEVSSDGSSWSDLDSDTDSTSTSYTHTGLTAGSTRYYRVSAINSAGTGSVSNTDSAATESQANSAPEPVGAIPEQVITPREEITIDISPYFSDPERR